MYKYTSSHCGLLFLYYYVVEMPSKDHLLSMNMDFHNHTDALY